jgi:flagellar motor protein MotB
MEKEKKKLEREKKRLEKEAERRNKELEKEKKKLEKEAEKRKKEQEREKKKMEKEAEKKNKKLEKENKKLEKVNKKVEKKININELKKEWLELYNKLKDNKVGYTMLSINENDNNFLDIKLSRTEKIIGLTGKGTLVLRKLSDMGMVKNEYINTYLPKNFNNKSYMKPLWNIKHGYMYFKNDINLKNLKTIIDIINYLNNKYNSYRISSSLVEEKEEGIIGVDIKYEEPEWVSKLVPGNKIYNPIINKNKQIVFSKCAITVKTLELANKYLNKKMNNFKDIYENYIYLTTTKSMSLELEKFIKSDKTIGLIAYDKHARIIFKKEDKLIIIDPWKQTVDKGTKDLIGLIPDLSFIKRKAEQTTEGSCVAVSYARALYMADKGIDVINNEIPFDYIVLTSRLISKFRVKN